MLFRNTLSWNGYVFRESFYSYFIFLVFEKIIITIEKKLTLYTFVLNRITIFLILKIIFPFLSLATHFMYSV